MIIKSKRTIMGLAALMILIFHFYIPVFRQYPYEKQMASLCFIGVDLFFLVSGASCSKAGRTKYHKFVLNRLVNVWLPFALFALVAAFYKSWSIGIYFENIFGIRLFTKGGGAFCWFFPGIMIFYILAPVFVKLKNKLGMPALGILLFMWLAIVLGLQLAADYTTIFILLNRLPIFLIGIWLDKFNFISSKLKWPLTAAGLLGGGALFYYITLVARNIKVPADLKYVAAVPFVLALTALVNTIAEYNKLKFQLLKWMGGFTLELYALQMIFGYAIIGFISKKLGTNAGAFLVTIALLAVMAFALALIKKCIIQLVEKRRKK